MGRFPARAQAPAPAPVTPPEPLQGTETPSRPARTRKIKAAMAFLKEALSEEPRPAREVEAEALAAGHARSTLHLARQRAHIRSERRDNRYIWFTPAQRKQPSARAASNARVS